MVDDQKVYVLTQLFKLDYQEFEFGILNRKKRVPKNMIYDYVFILLIKYLIYVRVYIFRLLSEIPYTSVLTHVHMYTQFWKIFDTFSM